MSKTRNETIDYNNTLSRSDDAPKSTEKRWTSRLFLSVIIVVLSTSFVMGVNIGGPNLYNGFVVPWIRGHPFPCQKETITAKWIAVNWWNCSFNSTINTTSDYYYLPEVPRSALVNQRLKDSLHNVLFVIGGFMGAYSGQFWYKCLSRRNAIIANFPFQIIASILMIITLYIYNGYINDPDKSTIAEAIKHQILAKCFFFISRFLSGFSAGMCCVLSTSYLNDISPRELRGTVGSCHQLAIVIGILVGQTVSLPWLLGRHDTWNWGMGWVGLCPLIGCLFVWKLPESPQWLIQQCRPSEAAESLRSLRQMNDVEDELIEIQQEENSDNEQHLGLLQIFSSVELRWPLITSLTLNSIQQLSGISAVFFYSEDMFSVAGLRNDQILWGIISTGVVNVIATFASLKLIETLGRRSIVIYTLAAIGIVMVCLTVFITVNEKNAEEKKGALAIVTIIFILFFIALFAIGLGPIPYVYSNEVFSTEARAISLSLAMFINWFSNLLVTLLFLPIKSAIEGFVFLIFCLFVVIAFILLLLKMPETKNKKLTEIQAFWKLS